MKTTDQYHLYKILARYRAGELDGKMWPEGQPLGYVHSGLYAIHRWETREITCPNCKQEANAVDIELFDVCLTCQREVLQDIVDMLKMERGLKDAK